MFTTQQLRKNIPVYYDTLEDCRKNKKRKESAFFICTKEYEFQKYKDQTTTQFCMPKINLTKNIFINNNLNQFNIWSKYRNITGEASIQHFQVYVLQNEERYFY